MVTKLDAIKRRRLQLSPELIWRTEPDGSTTDVSEEESQTEKDLDTLLAVADELAAFLRVMNGAPSEFAFMSLIERLEIVMRPLLKETE